MDNSINDENKISRNKNFILIKPSMKCNNSNHFPQQAGNFLELMPANYIYNLIKWNIYDKEINYTFEVDLSSEEEFQIWFEAFKIKSCSQFNVRTSKKGEGKFMLLRILYKCIHNVHGGILGKRKHTGCPTQLKVTIYPAQKKQYLLVNERKVGMCKMQLRWHHNHPLKAADVLKSQMDKRLEELFNKGHNPTTARQSLLTEAEENGRDQTAVPDYKHIYYVFKKLSNRELRDDLIDKSVSFIDNLDNEYDKANMDNDLNSVETENVYVRNADDLCSHAYYESQSIVASREYSMESKLPTNINSNLIDENGIVFVPLSVNNISKPMDINCIDEHQETHKITANIDFNNDGQIMNNFRRDLIENFNRVIELSLSNPDSVDVSTKLYKLLQSIKTPRNAITFLRKITQKRKAHKFKRLNK